MKQKLFTLVTGAGKGLGKALAIECACRNMNLVLVSLPGEELHELGLQLEQQYGVDVVTIEKDLCMDGACEEVFDELMASGINISMLINNAGTGNTELFRYGRFTEYERQIRLNVLVTTRLTYLFVDILEKSGPSYILNVGSLASFFSLAKKQVYGATKSYISYFSKSLRRELKEHGISVSVLCPGGMHTNKSASETLKTGSYITRASAMEPEDVAPIAINGLLHGKELIIPGKINQTIVFLNRILPRFIVKFFETRTMKRLHNPGVIRNIHQTDAIPAYSKVLIK